jgi:predicted dithiol-disulfide oxidoreductase (DUF899 family)
MAETPSSSPQQNSPQRTKRTSPNESPEYRLARNALLAEEIELRRHVERVAAPHSGRALPQAAESLKTILSKAMRARSASLSSSATRTPSLSTA